VVEIDLSAGLDGEQVARQVLGRSGTLRAPVARVGATCLVGFNADAWGSTLAV
jgi:hypothetical protein